MNPIDLVIYMSNTRPYITDHLKTGKRIILGYIVFAGCFTFPFGNILFPFDLFKGFMVAASYGVIAYCFAAFYREGKILFVYAATFSLTVIGMILRFLLEYGEHSNTINFTFLNIIMYLTLIPLLVTLFYLYFSTHLFSRDRK